MPAKKKDNSGGLGKALIKRQGKGGKKVRSQAGALVAAVDGGDALGPLQSVLEASSLDDFLANAVMSDRQFVAEKENAIVLDAGGMPYAPSDGPNELDPAVETVKHKNLSVPRRPAWDRNTTAEQLNKLEKESFLSWRRDIASLEETSQHLSVTPFEKNLEVWRQLWRVMERSNVLIQIVDARNPLFYRSEDLEKYAHEIDDRKRVITLINKADFLTDEQRRVWSIYFDGNNIEHYYFSARMSQRLLDEKAKEAREDLGEDEDGEYVSSQAAGVEHFSETHVAEASSQHGTVTEVANKAEIADSEGNEIVFDSLSGSEEDAHSEQSGITDVDDLEEEIVEASPICKEQLSPSHVTKVANFEDKRKNGRITAENWAILSREELLDKLNGIARDLKHQFPLISQEHGGRVQIGMVGFPNVGKSSLINVLLGVTAYSHGVSRVGVGATPGKTKHFQTLILSEDVMLCDCPGLVFPSFVSSKGEMICSGVLPINQLRDHIPPTTIICARIPRPLFERVYNIRIPKKEGVDTPQADMVEPRLLLQTYASARGYWSAGSGLPNESLSARLILKDFVSGKLVHCHHPSLAEASDAGSASLASSFTAKEVEKIFDPLRAFIEGGYQALMDAGDKVESDTQESKNPSAVDFIPAEPLPAGKGKVNRKKPSEEQLAKKGRKKGSRDPNPYGCGEDGVTMTTSSKTTQVRALGKQHNSAAFVRTEHPHHRTYQNQLHHLTK